MISSRLLQSDWNGVLDMHESKWPELAHKLPPTLFLVPIRADVGPELVDLDVR